MTAREENGPQAIGKSRRGWTTRIHMVAADARTTIVFALSPGQAGNGPRRRALLQSLVRSDRWLPPLLEKVYEGDKTRQLAPRPRLHPCCSTQQPTFLNHGNSTAKCTSADSTSNAGFVAPQASIVSSPDSTRWTSCSSLSSISRALSKDSDSVNGHQEKLPRQDRYTGVAMEPVVLSSKLP